MKINKKFIQYILKYILEHHCRYVGNIDDTHLYMFINGDIMVYVSQDDTKIKLKYKNEYMIEPKTTEELIIFLDECRTKQFLDAQKCIDKGKDLNNLISNIQNELLMNINNV